MDIAISSGKGVLCSVRSWVLIAVSGSAVVLGATAAVWWCERPENFTLRSLFEVDVDAYGIQCVDTRIGDHDRDGTPDLLVASDAPGVLALVLSGRSGKPLLTVAGDAPEHATRRAVAAGDQDGDGVGDILVGLPEWRDETGRVELSSGASGQSLRSWEGEHPGARLGAALLGGRRQDGLSDLVLAAPGAGLVLVCSAADGSIVSTLRGAEGESSFGLSLVALGDLDGDGRGEVGVGAERDGEGELVVLTSDGWNPRFTSTRGEDRRNPHDCAPFGDDDGDGIRDLLVGADDHLAVVSGADGSLLRRLVVGSENTVPAAIGDYDGDGVRDVLYRAGSWASSRNIGPSFCDHHSYAWVHVLSGRTGEELLDVLCDFPFPRVAPPIDLDGDGSDEVCVLDTGPLRVYSWPESR